MTGFAQCIAVKQNTRTTPWFSKKKQWPWVLLFACFPLWSASKQNARTLSPAILQAVQPANTAQPFARGQKQATDPIENRLHNALKLDKNSRFSLARENTDQGGRTHRHYQQYYAGIPIYGEQLSTHSDASGELHSLTGYVITGLSDSLAPQATQKLSPSDAMEKAKKQADIYLSGAASTNTQVGVPPVGKKKVKTVPNKKFHNEKIERVIYLGNNGQAHYAYAINYLVDAEGKHASRPFFILDANSGEILKKWEGLTRLSIDVQSSSRLATKQREKTLIPPFDGLVIEKIGTGPGGNLKTGAYAYGTGTRPFLDITRQGNACSLSNGAVRTVDLDNGENSITTFSFLCPRNTHKSINGGFAPLNDAHYFGTVTDAMYKKLFGVAPLNAPIVQRVHYGNGEDNAFWDGEYTNFGDGSTTFYPLSTSLNVVAHETSHGVTEQHSGLIYDGQPGGINEAFSDMAGEAAEFFLHGTADWVVGADVIKAPGKALRYFARPTRDGVSISNATDYFSGLDVHYSSGVFNRAFYLLATSPGWNPAKAFSAFYYANINYWSPQSSFTDAACSVIDAAADQNYDKNAVSAAFHMVGIDCPLPPSDGDRDHMDDAWELANGLNVKLDDGAFDPDLDGLSNFDEYRLGANPQNADSDGDNIADAYDIYPNDADWLGFVRLSSFAGKNDMAGARAGYAVSSADVDGDGLSDSIIGMPFFSLLYNGEHYNNIGLVVVISGSTGEALWYQSGSWRNEFFGKSVAGTSDLDGDGLADFVIGIPGRDIADNSGAYMKAAGGVEAYNIFGLINSFDGRAAGDHFGASVAGIKTEQGTAYGDIIVGAPQANIRVGGKIKRHAGAAYIYNAYSGTLVAGLQSPAPKTALAFGTTVAGIGDITGDGRPDILVGAPQANGRGTFSGSVFPIAVYGGVRYLPAINGRQGEQLGKSLAALEDINGDGIADFAVGAPTARNSKAQRVGAVYLYLGQGNSGASRAASWFGAATNDYFGASIANIGDVDNDGRGDVLVGSYGHDINEAATGKKRSNVGLLQALSGADGHTLWQVSGTSAGEYFGWAVAAADVNADGKMDAIVGASGANTPISSGKKLQNTGAVSILSGSGGGTTPQIAQLP